MNVATASVERFVPWGTTSRSVPSKVACEPTPAMKVHTNQSIAFGQIGHGWQVVEPLPITIKRDDDGWYIVSSDATLVHGDGPTISCAIQDYYECLIEYYELTAEAAQGGNLHDQEELRHLEFFLHRTV